MKKSLSILLALLMILSSLPVMAFTASAEEADPNVLADYTYENWQQRRWDSSLGQGAEGLGDGNRIRMGANCQVAFTTVTLEPNKDYLFDFNWKSETNENGGGIYPNLVRVYAESEYGSNAALMAKAPAAALETYAGSGSWHHDNGHFYPAGKNGMLFDIGANLETLTRNDMHVRKEATAGTWQHLSAKFSTTSETNYAIMISFEINSTGDQGNNALQTSDFRLITTEESEKVAIEDKLASDWFIPANAKIFNDASFTQDGITSEYRLVNPVWQKFSTTVTLEPNTAYALSFDHYAKSYAPENHRMSRVEVLSNENGTVLDKNNWNGESYKYPSGKLADAFFEDPADTWNHAKVVFNTDATGKCNIIIHGSGSNFVANMQNIYFANFKIESVVAKKPGNLLNNATHANGDVTWTTTTDVDNRIGDIGQWGSAYQDNPDYSANGGYSWAFGFGDGRVGGNTDAPTDPTATPWPLYNYGEYKDVYAYVYIKANGLKSGATYDFSYIYRLGMTFFLDSIKSGDNTATVVSTSKEDMPQAKGEKTTALFTVPADGDYVITLKANRAYPTAYNNWSATYLCDLELYERGALYTVAATSEGNGSVKASASGLLEEGTTVTLTAKADLFERFLGWYNGDELVSKDQVYVATIAGDTNLVGKFTTYGENLMANYDTSKFVTRYWGSIQVGESHNGGYGIRAYNSPHQQVVTKVTLEAGKEYTLSFDWRSLENISNKEFIVGIKVQKILSPELDILGDKDATWVDGVGYKGQLGPDLETGGNYSTQEIANTCTWQNLTTKFTTTEAGEYAIILQLGHNRFDISPEALETLAEINRVNGTSLDASANNAQSVDFSDFVLKSEPVIEYTGTKYEWHGERWAKVSDSEDTKDGGYAYLVKSAMSQSISTTLEGLKPGTNYKFSFNWKAVENANGLAYVQAANIFSVNSGSNVHPTIDGQPDWDAPCNYEHYGEGAGLDYRPSYIPNEGYENVRTSFDNPNGNADADDAVLTNWNTTSGTFKTTDDADYYFFIVFDLKGSNGEQSVIISDLVIEEVVEGAAPAGDDMIDHPGVSIRKASESFYGQALRFKFTIDGNVIANAQADGYELVEYGTVVALTDSLAGHAADPILDATSYAVKTGVAYNKDNGTNIQYAVDGDGNVTYTAALYNIPTNQYGEDIAVRPYAIFRNAEGATYVRYGTTRTASVFAVVKAVLAGSNADDKDYVNNTMLVGDVKTAYETWATQFLNQDENKGEWDQQ